MTPEQEAIQAEREALDKTEAQPQQAPARNRGTAWLNRRGVRVLVWLFTAGIVGALFWIIYLTVALLASPESQGSTASVIAAAATGGCLFLAGSLAAWRNRISFRLLLAGFVVLYGASLGALWEISPLFAGSGASRQLGRQIEVFGQTWYVDAFVGSVAFSPDGRILASGSAESGIGTPRPHDPIQLWDVRTHRRLAGPIARRTGKVYSVAFSPDGRILASGSADGTVRFWNVRTHREILPRVPRAGDSVESVAFSPGGRVLASGSDDYTIRLWDVRTHKQLGRALRGHTDEVWSVAFSPNGRVVASGSADGTIRLWDVRTHRQLGRPLLISSATPLQVAHYVRTYLNRGPVHSFAVHSVVFSPDGRALASGGYDGTIRFWDVRTHRQLAMVEEGEGIRSVAFSSDGRVLASGGDDGTVRLWDVSTHRQLGGWLEVGQLPGIPAYGQWLDSVNSVAFSPDGRILAASGDDGTIVFWNVAGVGR